VEQISDLYHYIFNAKHRVALSILFLFSLLSKTMYCQDMVRGVVTEKGTNVPVAGAIVTIKGTVSVAQTGADGSFSIQAGKAGDTLIIQSVGYYIREIVVRGTAPLLITLKLFSALACLIFELQVLHGPGLNINQGKRLIFYVWKPDMII
jgi:hypothetical protein